MQVLTNEAWSNSIPPHVNFPPSSKLKFFLLGSLANPPDPEIPQTWQHWQHGSILARSLQGLSGHAAVHRARGFVICSGSLPSFAVSHDFSLNTAVKTEVTKIMFSSFSFSAACTAITSWYSTLGCCVRCLQSNEHLVSCKRWEIKKGYCNITSTYLPSHCCACASSVTLVSAITLKLKSWNGKRWKLAMSERERWGHAVVFSGGHRARAKLASELSVAQATLSDVNSMQQWELHHKTWPC